MRAAIARMFSSLGCRLRPASHRASARASLSAATRAEMASRTSAALNCATSRVSKLSA